MVSLDERGSYLRFYIIPPRMHVVSRSLATCIECLVSPYRQRCYGELVHLREAPLGGRPSRFFFSGLYETCIRLFRDEQAFPTRSHRAGPGAARHAGSTPLPQDPSITLCPTHPPAPAKYSPRERSFHRQSLQISLESRTAPLGYHWTQLKRLARVKSGKGFDLIALCAYTTYARHWRQKAGGRFLGGDELGNQRQSPAVTARARIPVHESGLPRMRALAGS